MSAARLPDIDPRRTIPVEGASNVRDLGGYETSDGRQTRWRTLFRAADIHALSPSAQSTLIDAGVRTVIDLRGSQELTEAPSVFKDLSSVKYRPHNMTGDALIDRWGTVPVPADSSIRLSTMYSTVLDQRGEMVKDDTRNGLRTRRAARRLPLHRRQGPHRCPRGSPARHRRCPPRANRRGLRPEREVPLWLHGRSTGRFGRERNSTL